MKYLIEKDREKKKILSVLMGDDGRAVEIHADLPDSGPRLGDIVIGRVEKVSENTGACFVAIARSGKMGQAAQKVREGSGVTGAQTVKAYLPFDEMGDPIYARKGPSPRVQQGDELVVQISREPFGQKGFSLTTRLQLKGRYLVLEKCGHGVGISRRMDEERRKHIKEEVISDKVLDQLAARLDTFGIIVRTNAEKAEDGRILDELKDLADQMQHITLTAPYKTLYTVLHRQPEMWLVRTDSLSEQDTEAIITDDPDLYDALSSYLTSPLSGRLRLYQDDMISMHNLFSLTREFGHALTKRVLMKSGANLVIEQTEALVAIDVNSSHFIKGKDKEKAALKVNLEAARECARQIRLRNLSGMILIDFINMQSEESYTRLMHELKAQTAGDPMKVVVVDRTGLGLVELTRRKVEPPLFVQMQQGGADYGELFQ